MNKITRIVPMAALTVCLAVGAIGTAQSPVAAQNSSMYNMQSGAYNRSMMHYRMMHRRQMTARQMMMRRQMMARQMMMRRQMRQRQMMRHHMMNQH